MLRFIPIHIGDQKVLKGSLHAKYFIYEHPGQRECLDFGAVSEVLRLDGLATLNLSVNIFINISTDNMAICRSLSNGTVDFLVIHQSGTTLAPRMQTGEPEWTFLPVCFPI